MDQIKIGKFISRTRKKQNLTQAELAEKLNITDRAISKWETGRALPDASIMIDLCNILKITVNDLLSGEVVTMNETNQKQEELLIEVLKEKELSDRRLMKIEVFIMIIASIILFGLIAISIFVDMLDWIKVLLISCGFIIFLASSFVSLKIEQVAGYYQCKECNNIYTPTYIKVVISEHFGTSRYMRCPKCNKKSWHKKILKK